MEASKVTIKIYNLLGKEMKTLVDENLPAGIYKTEWDGTDGLGHDAPSGLYLYRIMAGDRSEMHRMTKMK
jgi:flagellar hook assembly protein FlgD